MKRIIACVLVLAMAFGFAACTEDITSEKYIAKKTESYKNMDPNDLKVAEGTFAMELEEEGIKFSIKISENYWRIGNEKAVFEMFVVDGLTYAHIDAEAREANPDLEMEASEAYEAWYKFVPGEDEEDVDVAEELFSEFSNLGDLGDMSDIASVEFIETVVIDGVKYDKVKMTAKIDEELKELEEELGEEIPTSMEVLIDSEKNLIVSAEIVYEEVPVKIAFEEKKTEAPSIPSDVEVEELDSLGIIGIFLGFFMLLV